VNERRPLVPEDVYRLQIASDPQISPDASSVLFTLSQPDREKDEQQSAIWLAEVGAGEPRRFTQGPKRDSGARWSPDGSQIAFVSDRGDEGGKPQIYVMPADGGEPRRVTSLPEGAGSPVWSPDGRRIAFTSRVGAEREPEPADKEAKERLQKRPVEVNELKYKFDLTGHFRGRSTQIFTVTIDGGEVQPLTSGPFDNSQPAWSPDGAWIAFVSARHPERDFDAVSDIFIVSAEGGEPRQVTPGRGPCASPAWSPDGTRIAYAGNESSEGQFGARNIALYLIDASGGEPRQVTRDFDRSVTTVAPPTSAIPLVWSGDGNDLVFGAADGGAVHLYRVSAAGGTPSKVFDGSGGTVAGVSASRDGARLAVHVSRYDAPASIVVIRSDGSDPQQVTHFNEAIFGEAALSAPQRLSFRGADGGMFEGWLIRPAGSHEGQRHPLLLDVHGGPHGAWGPGFTSTALLWQTLAARGWAILYINPRGSGGYGEEFATYIRNAWGETDFPDFMTAVDSLVETGIADLERLAVTGYSYGGYMTNWIVGHTNRFKAAIAGGCVSNLVSFYGTSDIGSPFFDWEFQGTWWEQRERYARLSPISYVDRMTTPLLLMHAEGDLRCPIAQSEEMFVALQRQRKPVQFVRFPGGSHGFRALGAPSHQVEYSNRLIAWLERWVVGRGEPAEVRETAGVSVGD
jgi:dipeptidyl aminopeptidase/acylaminoacyl peptidase